jgi:hypothetical protein
MCGAVRPVAAYRLCLRCGDSRNNGYSGKRPPTCKGGRVLRNVFVRTYRLHHSSCRQSVRFRWKTCGLPGCWRVNFSSRSLGGVITYVSRGALQKKCGWADYSPLCRLGRGAAGGRLFRKKMQTRTFAFFSSPQPAAAAAGCPSPIEPFMKGLRSERPQGAERADPTF